MDLIRRRSAWPWIAVALGLLLMVPALLERASVEASNATYEHSMPAEELDALLQAGLDPDRVYGSLTDAGLGSVGLEMDTPADLAADGRLIFLTPSDLLALQLFAGESTSEIPTGDGTFLAFPQGDTWILDRIRAALPTIDIRPVEVSDTEFWFVSGTEELETLPIGYDDARIEELIHRGLDVIARIPEMTNPEYIRAELGRIHDSYGIDRVMFSGTATPFAGTPDDAALAGWLEDNDFTLLLIELVEQTGVGDYASRMTDVIRLHGLSFIEEVDPQSRVDRAVRGIKERNIRVLFYRYTPTLPAEDRLGELVDVMAGTNATAPGGMSAGVAEPFAELRPSPLLLLGGVVAAAGIGAAAGGVLYPPFALIGAAGMALLGILAGVTGSGLANDLLRLGVAVLFAVAAVFVARPTGRLRPATVEYAKAGLVTLAGGYVISGLAFDTSFLSGADSFWGVKALLLAPPALVAVAAAYRVLGRPRWADTVPILQLEVRAWHLAALAIAAGAVAYLTLRSDNTGAAFDIELAFRQELENLLYVRPRTKEFLVGFPTLLVGIVMASRTRYAWWLYVVAAVGTASAIDTFAHFHAPLLASTVRTVLGLVIGYALGLLALWLIGLGERGIRGLGILPRR